MTLPSGQPPTRRASHPSLRVLLFPSGVLPGPFIAISVFSEVPKVGEPSHDQHPSTAAKGRTMIPRLFRAIDSKDLKTFASFLSPECVSRFGNGPAVEGVNNIEQYVRGFFDSIRSLSHELVEVWEVTGGIVCHGRVSYTRHNGTVLTIPFAKIFSMKNNAIAEYLIFADTSTLYG